MADATELTMGVRANCSDGPCGELVRVVVDPATRAITHLVIDPKHEEEPGRLVPLELVDSLVDSTAGEIRLRCSVAEFGRLEHAEETEFVQDAGGDPMSGMPTPTGIPHRAQTVDQDVVPKGEGEVGHDDPVYTTDGPVGRVQGFLIDPGDYRITHVLLKEGHLFSHKEVAIPMSAVAGVQDGIKLNITKKEVEGLPPVR